MKNIKVKKILSIVMAIMIVIVGAGLNESFAEDSYKVTVINGKLEDGKTEGVYTTGSNLKVIANKMDEKHFVEWNVTSTSDNIIHGSLKNPELNFTMPESDVKLTAVFAVNKYTLQITVKNDDKLVGSDVRVNLYDSNDKKIDYEDTNSKSVVKFTDLEYGTYKYEMVDEKHGTAKGKIDLSGDNGTTIEKELDFLDTSYDVSIDVTGNGTVKSNKSTVKHGDSVRFDISTLSSYEITSFRINGSSYLSDINDNEFTYKNVKSDLEVVAVFKAKSTGGSGTGTGTGSTTGSTGNNNTQTPSTPVFNDMQGHWAQASVEALAAKGIVSGTGDNKFSPEASVTRAEFVKMLFGASGANQNILSQYSVSEFTDVKNEDWYCQYVMWAVKIGIANGVGDNLFDPNKQITREQMAVMVNNLVKSQNRNLNQKFESMEFADNNEISAYAIESIYAMQRSGVISGNENGLFNPKKTATRAQAATIIYNFINN